jgi:hypothetical protein
MLAEGASKMLDGSFLLDPGVFPREGGHPAIDLLMPTLGA